MREKWDGQSGEAPLPGKGPLNKKSKAAGRRFYDVPGQRKQGKGLLELGKCRSGVPPLGLPKAQAVTGQSRVESASIGVEFEGKSTAKAARRRYP